jgi:hypothetical protein
MLAKMSKDEFIKLVIGLQQEEKKQFCVDYNEETKDGSCWYAVQKTKWLDSRILMIGGYDQHTDCLDIGSLDNNDLEEYVTEFISNYFEHEWIPEEVFVNMGEIDE